MELCAIPTLPNLLPPQNPNSLLLKPYPSLPLLRRNRSLSLSLLSRSRRNVSSQVRASFSSEESSSGEEEPGSKVAVEDAPAPASAPNTNSFAASGLGELVNEESATDQPSIGFLSDSDFKFDFEDTYSIILYGASALTSLWLASAVLSAIDSIPLFPKLMEVVGLGYSFWFTTRYLLFKENRDELGAKIEELKQQVLGSDG